MSTFVAADASPLIGFAAAQLLYVLRDLFGTVTITKLVKEEVAGRGDLPGARELREAMREGWIRVAPAPLETWRFVGIDPGEASTLALARRHADALVLMDDAAGRAAAAEARVAVAGIAEVLLMAKRAKLVSELRPIFQRLARRGFTLEPESVRSTLLAAGEEPL